MTKKKFEQVVEAAIEELPEEFRRRLENIAVIVEEEPDPEVLDDLEIPEDEELFGLFEGANVFETPGDFSGGVAPELPRRVLIYRGPLLRCCNSVKELKQEIRDTLVHEIGHYFGLEDDEMPY